MKRNLEILALCLVVVLGTSAVAVPPAWAQTDGRLTVSNGSIVTLDGTEAGTNKLTIFSGEVECPGSIMKGHKATETPHVFIPVNTSEITIEPFFVNCFNKNMPGKPKMTVTMNGCDFVAKIGQTTGGVENTYGVSFGVQCNSQAESINFEMYAFSGSELGGVQCTIKITTQADLTGTHLTTEAANDEITIAGPVSMHGERSGAACATATEGVEQHISVRFKGTNTNGQSTGITVTH